MIRRMAASGARGAAPRIAIAHVVVHVGEEERSVVHAREVRPPPQRQRVTAGRQAPGDAAQHRVRFRAAVRYADVHVVVPEDDVALAHDAQERAEVQPVRGALVVQGGAERHREPPQAPPPVQLEGGFTTYE